MTVCSPDTWPDGLRIQLLRSSVQSGEWSEEFWQKLLHCVPELSTIFASDRAAARKHGSLTRTHAVFSVQRNQRPEAASRRGQRGIYTYTQRFHLLSIILYEYGPGAIRTACLLPLYGGRSRNTNDCCADEQQNGFFARPSGVGGAAQNDNAGCVRLCFGLRALIECLQAGESTRSNAIRQMP